MISEQWVREHFDEITEWELFNIFIDNQYSESFMREMWPFIAPTGAVERFHYLSLDFLREVGKDIFWDDLFQHNDRYTQAERDAIYKEFNLNRKFNLI